MVVEIGRDGQGEDASFNDPCRVAVDLLSGQVVVADSWNNRIRLVDMKSGMVSTLAGSGRREWKDGQGKDASFYHPRDVAVDPMSGQVVVADLGNHRIRLVDIKTGMVSTLAGSGRGYEDGQGEDASFNYPNDVAVDPMSGQVFVADTYNNRIRLVDIETGMVSTLAGSGRGKWKDGQGEDASFHYPRGVTIDPMSGQVIVADTWNNRIRLVDIKTGMVSTLAGSGRSGCENGQGEDASFYRPRDVAMDPMSGQVIVADAGNDLIRCISNCGFVGVLEWELFAKQAFSDLAADEIAFIPNPIVDIILMYCNLNFQRKLRSC